MLFSFEDNHQKNHCPRFGNFRRQSVKSIRTSIALTDFTSYYISPPEMKKKKIYEQLFNFSCPTSFFLWWSSKKCWHFFLIVLVLVPKIFVDIFILLISTVFCRLSRQQNGLLARVIFKDILPISLYLLVFLIEKILI